MGTLWTLFKQAMLLASPLLILTGCASMMGTSGSLSAARLSEGQRAQVCSLWIGIGWEDGDTDPTITEVKVNNAKRDAYCAGVK